MSATPGVVPIETEREPGTRAPADIAASIVRQMECVLAPGQVVELRALGLTLPGESPRAVLSGYFDSVPALAEAAAGLDGYARGIYFTLNPLRPELLGRAPNRFDPRARAATDADVLSRRWLPVDLDPTRPKDTNSTDDELTAAIERADHVWRALRDRGWPDPFAAISGNGSHLLYRVDLPADNDTVKRLLRKLASEFSDQDVRLDPAVSNAGRIWKLYGTLARKGANTPERPWRRALLLGASR